MSLAPTISYHTEPDLAADAFIHLLEASTLAARRPVSDRQRIEGMLAHADLIITARAGTRLVGVARSVTDFHYCCYLSDLAVDREYQRRGIGTGLIRATQDRLRPNCRLLLLSAPGAVDYYPRVGFERHAEAWTLPPGCMVKS
jgi:predicted N-acetyltransferase YhbS